MQKLSGHKRLLSPQSAIEMLHALDAADIGAFNPWWDVAAARHETADFRLFIS
jgi:urease accessory protein UreF